MKRVLGPMLLALGLLSVTVACDDDDDDGDGIIVENPGNAGTKPTLGAAPDTSVALLGQTFQTRCVPKGILDLTSSTREISYSIENTFEKRESYFLGDDCGDAPYLQYRVTGDVAEKGQDPANTSVYLIDYTIGDAYLTITNETFVVSLNARAFCGKTDWAHNKEESITGLNCEGFTVKSGDVIQDVYAKEEKTIYFGESFTLMLASGSRPTGVNRDVAYTQLGQ